MIRSVQEYISYFASIRKRTLNYVRMVPDDRLHWAPKDGEFTCADIVRHIAAGEVMFVRLVMHDVWKYGGHSGDEATTAALLEMLDRTHAAAMEELRALPDAELDQPRHSLEGNTPIKAWRWLLALVEHEIHHRSQLAMYLTLMGITPPHIYGLGVEDIIARATG